MKFFGDFWAFISIILMVAAALRIVATGFYNKFIRGLSKKQYRGLINTTMDVNNILQDNHVVFGVGAFISAIIHIMIMEGSFTFSFLGLLTMMTLLFIVVTGVINKFIYRDKNGEFKKIHIVMVLILIFFLILHMSFG
ncbi:MAG: hypothetical protein RR486_13255 [Clostridium sp.]|uniref:hypothetical protein n=1 Tax=Clostridium sp. TaxID=1506 RepID=UPI00303FBC0F